MVSIMVIWDKSSKTLNDVFNDESTKTRSKSKLNNNKLSSLINEDVSDNL